VDCGDSTEYQQTLRRTIIAFTGKLAGVSGRKLYFGSKLGADGKPVEAGENPPGKVRYEHEFTLKQDGKVLRGEHPNFTPANLSDLKTGIEVRLCGVPFTADDPPEAVTEAHSIIILDEVKKPPAKAAKKAKIEDAE